MADQKLSDLTSGAPAAATDLIYAVKDPAGTPADAKLTLGEVIDLVEASPNSFTAAQTITPLTDAAALTVRRNSSGQTSNIFQVQTEANAALASIDKSGNVTGGTYNKVTITAPASGSTLTIADGKTLTASNTLTLAGTDSTTMTFPSTSATLARTDAGNTFTGSQTITGGTITADAPVLNASQTWNSSGVTFTGLKANFTDTASASGSLLMDLQVGGSSKFSISKSGISSAKNITAGGTTGVGFQILDTSGNGIQWALSNSSAGNRQAAFYPVGDGASSMGVRFVTNSTYQVQISSISPNGSNYGFVSAPFGLAFGSDTSSGNGALLQSGYALLRAKATNNIQLGLPDAAAPVAQTLSVQSVVAGTSNTAGANLTITGSQGTGTGAGGSIVFQVAPAGSSGTAQNALATALTIASDKNATFGSRVFIPDGSVSAPSFAFDNYKTTGMYFDTTDVIFGFVVQGIKAFYYSSVGIYANSFRLGTSMANFDVFLQRDAANTLALRNGTNAQAFNIYNTYTDASNYERGFSKWASNVFTIGTEKLGTGTARDLRMDASGSVFDVYVLGARQLYVSSSFTQIDSGRLDIPGSTAQIKLGGTGASATMIKRSSTTLQVRLADDSAYGSVQGKLTTDTAYAAGDPTTTGYLVIYDSTGTAYKIPAVAV